MAKKSARPASGDAKDFASQAQALDTVVLGQGRAPLNEAAAWLRSTCPDLWMIAEQDQSDQPAAVAVTENGKFLNSVFGN